MSQTTAPSVQPDVLSGLIAFDADDRAMWPAADLRACLHYPLQARMLFGHDASADAEQTALDDLASLASPPIRSFEELLHHPRPPMALLWIVKDSAKLQAQQRGGRFPPEVWMLLYYGSVMAAYTRHNQRITSLNDDELRDGLNWMLRQSWIDQRTRGLLFDWLRFLCSSRRLWRR